MSHTRHTTGPVRVFSPLGDPQIVTDRPTAYETQYIVVQFAQPNADINARLVAASYNALDSAAKAMGVNAVGLAERMQDGGIAALVRALADFVRWTELHHLNKADLITGGQAEVPVVINARAALAMIGETTL